MNRTVRDILLEHKMPRVFLILALLIVGSLIVITIITTNAIAAPNAPQVLNCWDDVQGANDEPGQKDLTNMCIDYDYNVAPWEYQMTWNWDDTEWSGKNTGNACSLYDTNGNGLVDAAVCVSIYDGDYSSSIAPSQQLYSPILYSCVDSKPDSCAGPTRLADNAGNPSQIVSTCGVAVLPDDPFLAGAYYPDDTVANCKIDLDEIPIGTEDPMLIDDCSIPSESPNSDPSDCIFQTTKAGKLEVTKELVPSDDGGLFDLYITGVHIVYDVGNLGTTGEWVVDVGDYEVGEYAGTSTNLDDYWKMIVCKDLNGAGAIVAETTDDDPGPLTVPVADNDDIVCVVSNYYDPTAVEMANFEAKGQIGTVLIEWTTVFEIDNDGFNLYRSDSLVGGKAKINDELIPTKSSGEFVMTSYQYMDQGLQMGQTYYYWLESVSASGVLNQFAPDSAVSLYGIYLSLVMMK